MQTKRWQAWTSDGFGQWQEVGNPGGRLAWSPQIREFGQQNRRCSSPIYGTGLLYRTGRIGSPGDGCLLEESFPCRHAASSVSSPLASEVQELAARRAAGGELNDSANSAGCRFGSQRPSDAASKHNKSVKCQFAQLTSCAIPALPNIQHMRSSTLARSPICATMLHRYAFVSHSFLSRGSTWRS